MITYNHEAYIEQAVESIMMQATEFGTEVVIGDDCSADGTRDKLRMLDKKYPGKIRLLLNTANVGIMKNFVNVLRNCRGKYIALLEGDDYWTDAGKLALQVTFLEQEPSYSACFHNVEVLGESSGSRMMNPIHKDLYDIQDVIQGWVIATGSLVFRKESIEKHFDLMEDHNIISGDRCLLALLADRGNIRCFSQSMGVWRRHATGASASIDKAKIFRSNIYLYNKLLGHFGSRHKAFVNNALFKWSGVLSVELRKKGRLFQSLHYLWKSALHIRSFLELKAFIKLYLLNRKP
jgi:glycosyltransferase involved in cell wall biosynthesis